MQDQTPPTPPTALAELLAEIAPTLRARIRSRKSRRRAAFSTSDIYATVVRRTLDIGERGGVRAAEGAAPDEVRDSPRFWALLHTLIDRAMWRKDRTERRSAQAREAQGRLPRPEGDTLSPETRAVDAELRERLQRLLATLGESDQLLLRLRLQGQPWEAVASATGQSAAVCRQRWHRLMERIGQALGQD
ncbi:MAG: hypothetical protein ACO31E_09430 [Phycisphaerales bacterium]|jgi:hypothetical protein